MILKPGESYLWVFFTYFTAFIGAMFLPPFAEVIPVSILVASVPLFLGFMLYSQLRSQIALDSWWTANHPAGSRKYSTLITWNALGIAGAAVFALLVAKNEFLN